MDIIRTQFKPWNSNAFSELKVCVRTNLNVNAVQYRVRHNWHKSPIEHYYMVAVVWIISLQRALAFTYFSYMRMKRCSAQWQVNPQTHNVTRMKVKWETRWKCMLSLHAIHIHRALSTSYVLHAICGHNKVGASTDVATASAFTSKLIKNMSQARVIFVLFCCVFALHVFKR